MRRPDLSRLVDQLVRIGLLPFINLLLHLVGREVVGAVDEGRLEEGCGIGLTREEIIGIFVQATPYIGLPKANHGIRAAMRAFKKIDEEKAAG